MELLMILVLVLVLFGAKRVPEIGASIGKGIREFKRSMNDIGDSSSVVEAPRQNLASVEDVEEQRTEPRRLLNR